MNLLPILFFVLLNFFLFIFFDKIKLFHLIQDIPTQNKIHHKPMPLAGGIIVFINLLIYFLFENLDLFGDKSKVFFLGCFLTFLLGIIDDKYNLSYIVKFIFLSLIFTFIFFLEENFQVKNLYFKVLELNINLDKYSLSVTILCLLLFSNALNMFDGINLQAINFSIITCLFFLVKNPSNVLLIIILSLFLLFLLNIKNKLFLGNSGSYLIAFIISYFLITNYNKNVITSCEEIFILLILPGLDMLRLFIERILNKKNPFKGDTNHYHHILLREIKFSKTTTITLIIILSNFLSLVVFNLNELLIILTNLFIYLILIYSKSFRKFIFRLNFK
tara:strand:- start:8864 stop:9859 length:996 start_codon:yes stop_codon:yes gene_type:complete